MLQENPARMSWVNLVLLIRDLGVLLHIEYLNKLVCIHQFHKALSRQISNETSALNRVSSYVPKIAPDAIASIAANLDSSVIKSVSTSATPKVHSCNIIFVNMNDNKIHREK